jgi:KaiC/GvpD/RAD55 family RecA-like ATPase
METEVTSTGKVPKEILEFFRSPGGHSLIIKGDAGTGKTTFALQLIEEIFNEQIDYYLSTRVSDEALFRQFPWLREKAKNNEILKAGKKFLRKTAPSERDRPVEKRDELSNVTHGLLDALLDAERAPSVVRTELHKLEGQIESGGIGPEGEDLDIISEDGAIVLDMGAIMPELDLAYDVVESNLPTRTLIVLDSIEALSESYGISAPKIMNTLQKDMVEHSNTNIAYVLESSGKSPLDYLGDGVVSLHIGDLEGRRVRSLVIEKLRGSSVHKWRYLFTLKDGRMNIFEDQSFDWSNARKKRAPQNEPEASRISMGHPSLDSIYKGFPKGGLTLIEIGKNVPQDAIAWLENLFVIDHLSRKRGLFWFPQYSLDYDQMDVMIKEQTGVDKLSELLCVLDNGKRSIQEHQYIKVMEGNDANNDLRLDRLSYGISKAEKPYAALIGFDSLEDLYGKDVMPDISPFFDSMRRAGHSMIVEATEISSSLPTLAHQAKMHFKIQNIDGSVLICGQKPFSPYYHIEFKDEDGEHEPILVPMI